MRLHCFNPRFLAASAVFGLFAFANGADAMTISPPTFSFTVNPGSEIMDVLHIRNEDPFPVTLEPFVLNFAATPGDETSGTPRFYADAELPEGRGIASWIGVEIGEQVTIPPGGLFNVPFTVHVPERASPGSYFGAILLKTPEGDHAGGPPAVGVRGGASALLFVRVAGDAQSAMSITQFSSDRLRFERLPVDFRIRVENQGTVHVYPQGNIFIYDLFGRQVASLPVNESLRAVLPDSARRFEATWTRHRLPEDASEYMRQWRNFAIGPYRAELVLNYDTNKQETAIFSFWVVPWMVLLTMCGAAVMLITLLSLGLKAYNRSIIARYERSKRSSSKQV